MNSCHILSKVMNSQAWKLTPPKKTELSQAYVYAIIEGRIARYDGPRLLTQVRLHCAPDVTAPHSFNMLLQQCAKEQKLSVIVANTPQPRAAHFAHKTGTYNTSRSHLRRANPLVGSAVHFAHKNSRHKGPRYDSKCPPRHNASPLCAQNSHRATTGDHVTIQYGHRATTPAHFVHKIRTAHNVRPRYDPKLSPRHTRTLNNDVLLAHREYSNPFNFSNARSTLRLQVFL